MSLQQLLSVYDIQIDSKSILLLENFASLLQQWNQVHNLTGAKTIEDIYKNIADALYPITFINPPTSMLDVGTGAGFPGLILGAIWKNTHTTLCEPLGKRVAFLKYSAMELGLDNITVIKDRVENIQHEPFDLITSRAVTDTKLLLKLTQNISDKNTSYLFYKGSKVFDELEALQNQQNYDIVQKNKRNYLWIHQ